MIVLKDYTIKEQNGIYYIITSSTPNCPDCGGELKTRDSKKRKLISSDGTVNTFALRRYKCRGCGRVQMEFLRMCDQWLWVPVSQEWLAGVFFFYMVDGQDRNIGTAQIWRDEISETLPSEKPVNCVFYRHDRTWNTYSPNMDNIQIVSMCVI